MQRIRTVKPELFMHEALFDAEQESGLPLRVAYIGLWTCCDREGRFKWRPRALKLQILPYDELDFSRVLDALFSRGFIIKYLSGTEVFGCVPSFTTHQIINNRESLSALPSPDECELVIPDNSEEYQAFQRGIDASSTRVIYDDDAPQGEGKGREGKGTGKEQFPAVAPTSAPKKRSETNPINVETWQSYAFAYFNRYGVDPVRNATVNGQIANFVKRLGEHAPHVAAFYVDHSNSYYLTKGHAVGPMLMDAEKLHTEWATGRRVTQTAARQADRTQTNFENSKIALDMLNAKYGGSDETA